VKSKIIGIDEVGRGPLAGPVAVCAFSMPIGFDDSIFGKLRDSKKLSAKKREQIFEQLEKMRIEGAVNYSVCYASANEIDNIGISICIKKCLEEALLNIKADPKECKVLLDGGLYAPKEFEQETIIKGDEKERVIALASIVAKVSRDKLMVSLAEEYKEYGFNKHKGYGTKAHMEAIKKYGMCIEHRRTFCHLPS
jgi:ribonuclease HII